MFLNHLTSLFVLMVLLDIVKGKCDSANGTLLLKALAFDAEPLDQALLVNDMSADGNLLDALFLMKVFATDFAVFRLT